MKKILGLVLVGVILGGCQSDNLNEGVTITPSNEQSGLLENVAFISEDDAKLIAYGHAGVSESDVTFVKCKLEYDSGVAEYEVDFYVGSIEYDYEINATSGVVVSYGQDLKSKLDIADGSQSYISEYEAKSIAYSHAGVSESEVSYVICELDYDRGVAEYEIEFYVGITEYEYEVHATSGEVISYSQEVNNQVSSGDASASYISQDQAKQIALSHAGLSLSDVDYIKCEFDFDRGVAEYEVEFAIGRTEYEYEINANTGEIISFEKDYD